MVAKLDKLKYAFLVVGLVFLSIPTSDATSSTNYNLKNFEFGNSTTSDGASSNYNLDVSVNNMPEGLIIVDEAGNGSQNDNGSGDNDCDDEKPGPKAPVIYAAIPGYTSIWLYFNPADNPVNYYEMQFGTATNDYKWGAIYIGNENTRAYEVKKLSSNATYYFRVRAGHGCAAGDWSNAISARTTSFATFNDLTVTSVGVTSTPETTSSSKPQSSSSTTTETTGSASRTNTLDVDLTGTLLTIKVRDQKDKPISKAAIKLYPSNLQKQTDTTGEVKFENVNAGEHKIEVKYRNFVTQQSLFIEDGAQSTELTIQIKMDRFKNPFVIGIGVFLFVVIFAITHFIIRKLRG